ncbi:MarR family winged helix-turn-helix transcriptional regulator [Dyella humicola]|uniref:MarR family winged helix-turn-helix transcriptional regulator n=1 Tax=Dyella humicola TaxID=2992126 RepID=UPI00225ADAC7|nr:MarR family transcriptional regulator [Dyella humicola]
MNHYTSKNFALTRSVGFLLNKARNMIIAEMDAALRDLEITSQHMGILLSLKSGVATTPFELSKVLGIDTGLMTRMLDKLEDKKLLKRVRSVDDRRVINLEMTARGEAVTTQLPQIAPQVLNARVKNFSKDEFDELRRLLGKFIGDSE